MKSEIIDIISKTLNVKSFQTINTIQLLDDGSTVPFISRYRKEKTGSLDELQILRRCELGCDDGEECN